MRDQHGDAAQRIPRKDVAAAWICCVLAAAAGLLLVAGPNADTSRRDAYAGVYLPGRDVVAALYRRDDDLDDDTEQIESPAPNPPGPQLCATPKNSLYAATEPPSNNTTPSLKC